MGIGMPSFGGVVVQTLRLFGLNKLSLSDLKVN